MRGPGSRWLHSATKQLCALKQLTCHFSFRTNDHKCSFCLCNSITLSVFNFLIMLKKTIQKIKIQTGNRTKCCSLSFTSLTIDCLLCILSRKFHPISMYLLSHKMHIILNTLFYIFKYFFPKYQFISKFFQCQNIHICYISVHVNDRVMASLCSK